MSNDDLLSNVAFRTNGSIAAVDSVRVELANYCNTIKTSADPDMQKIWQDVSRAVI